MEDIARDKAREHVKNLRGFYSNLISFAVVNVVLILVNLATTPNQLWFYWVTLFWGIALIFHAVDVFTIRGKYFGQDWEDRKIDKIMEEQRGDEDSRKAG